jgi:hypothetical protein
METFAVGCGVLFGVDFVAVDCMVGYEAVCYGL